LAGPITGCLAAAEKDKQIMAARKTTRQEIDELRREIEELRRTRSGPRKAAAGKGRGKQAEAGMVERARAEFSDLEKAIEDLVKAAEDEITDRPVISLAVAFFLGLLIGRLTGR